MRIAFDIGGTCTGFALHDPAGGRIAVSKVRTTLREPARALLDGLRARIATGGLRPEAMDAAPRMTNIAANANLERMGARTAPAMTDGLRDVLPVGRRQKRYGTDNPHLDKTRPLVRHASAFEFIERLHPTDAALKPSKSLAQSGVRGVATAKGPPHRG